eukprot:365708-Chlamydomonas_euryale.AAC.8
MTWPPGRVLPRNRRHYAGAGGIANIAEHEKGNTKFSGYYAAGFYVNNVQCGCLAQAWVVVRDDGRGTWTRLCSSEDDLHKRGWWFGTTVAVHGLARTMCRCSSVDDLHKRGWWYGRTVAVHGLACTMCRCSSEDDLHKRGWWYGRTVAVHGLAVHVAIPSLPASLHGSKACLMYHSSSDAVRRATGLLHMQPFVRTRPAPHLAVHPSVRTTSHAAPHLAVHPSVRTTSHAAPQREQAGSAPGSVPARRATHTHAVPPIPTPNTPQPAHHTHTPHPTPHTPRHQVPGSVLALSDVFFLWRPRTLEDVTPESLGVLTLLKPRPEVLVLGCGASPGLLPPPVSKFLADHGIKVEVLDSVGAGWAFLHCTTKSL